MSWCLAQADFNAAAARLAARATRANAPGRWTWLRIAHRPGHGVLTIAGLRWRVPEAREARDEDDDAALADEDDAAALVVRAPCDDEGGNVAVECHVVWSVVYAVPMLLFTAVRDNGRALRLDEVVDAIEGACGLRLGHQRGTPFPTVLQEEHPYFDRPFFCLHPCNTPAVMHEMLRDVASPPDDHGVLAWLSLTAPLVGLHLPTALAVL